MHAQHFNISLCDQNRIDDTPVEVIDKRQRRHPTVSRVNTCITYDRSSTILQDTARPSNFLPSSKHRHTQYGGLRHFCVCGPVGPDFGNKLQDPGRHRRHRKTDSNSDKLLQFDYNGTGKRTKYGQKKECCKEIFSQKTQWISQVEE